MIIKFWLTFLLSSIFLSSAPIFAETLKLTTQSADDLKVILVTEQAQNVEFQIKIPGHYQEEDCSDVIHSAINTKREQTKGRIIRFFNTARSYGFKNEDFARVKNYFVWMLTFLDVSEKNAPTGGAEIFCSIELGDFYKLNRELDAIRAAIDAYDLDALKDTSFRLDTAMTNSSIQVNQPVDQKQNDALNTYYVKTCAENNLPYWKIQDKNNREELYSCAMRFLDEVVAINNKQYMQNNKDKIENALTFVSSKFFDGAQNDWLKYIEDAFKDEATIDNKKALTESLKFLANVSAGNEAYPVELASEKMLFASGYLATVVLNKATSAGKQTFFPDQYDYTHIKNVLDTLELNGLITNDDYRYRLKQLNQAYDVYQDMLTKNNTKELENFLKSAKAKSNKNSSNSNPLQTINSGLQKTNNFLKGLNKILGGG